MALLIINITTNPWLCCELFIATNSEREFLLCNLTKLTYEHYFMQEKCGCWLQCIRVLCDMICEGWCRNMCECQTFLNLSHSLWIISFCCKLNPWTTTSYKLQHMWLCGHLQVNLWTYFLQVFFLMMDSIMKACYWIIYLIPRDINSDLRTKRYQQAEPLITTILFIMFTDSVND